MKSTKPRSATPSAPPKSESKSAAAKARAALRPHTESHVYNNRSRENLKRCAK